MMPNVVLVGWYEKDASRLGVDPAPGSLVASDPPEDAPHGGPGQCWLHSPFWNKGHTVRLLPSLPYS